MASIIGVITVFLAPWGGGEEDPAEVFISEKY